MAFDERTILHCDMNNFYASVELLARPDLAGRPVAVCGDPDSRHGIILAKNELAKAAGVVTAETVWQARKKCPGLVFVPPHREKYKEYSVRINEIYLRYTDLVEPFSIDESWLDVTGSLKLFGSGRQIADEIRATVRRELSLTLSAGVSFNKIFAKMGSEYKKPDATTVISRENYRQILWPMDVGNMFFVGRVTAEKLRSMGIRTIGDLAAADRRMLTEAMGKQGGQLRDYAAGEDREPVAAYSEQREAKSVGNGMTFSRNLTSVSDYRTAVGALADKVGSRLRSQKLKCRGVKVDIKDPQFKTISRQKQLDAPTNLSEEIAAAAMELITLCWKKNAPIRLITVTAIALCPEGEAEQLSFFADQAKNREKQEKVERTMDAIRARFGGGSITFGGIVGNDLGIEPDGEVFGGDEPVDGSEKGRYNKGQGIGNGGG